MSVFTRSRAGKVLGGIAVVGASALILAGCAGGGGEAAETGGTSSEVGGELDLKIGTALPQTGNLAFLGPPEEPGVGSAAPLINEISHQTGLRIRSEKRRV